MRHLRAALAIALTAASCTSGSPSARPSSEPGEPVAIAVWSSRSLPASLAATLRRIEGVEAFGQAASGTFALQAVSAGARPLPRRPAGAVIPISIGGLDPAPLRAAGALPNLAAALERGEAALTRASARLRGLEAGGSITVRGSGGARRFRVGAIVPESDLLSAEVILPLADAVAMGAMPRRAYVLAVGLREYFETYDAIVEAIDGMPAGIRSLEGHEARPTVLPLAEVKRTFGEFWYRRIDSARVAIDPAWVDRNIVDASVPLLGTIRCNRRLIPQLTGAMRELQARGLAHLVQTFSGCYSPRTQVSNRSSISRHAYGIAVDINAPTNRYGDPPTQSPALVEVMRSWGFGWGGDWLIPDGMHFEYLESRPL